MVCRAFLEEQGQGRQEPELALLALALLERGIPVTRFTAKQLARRQLALSPESLVAGSIDSVRSALGAELDRAADGASPRFIKPAGHTKRFTGFVLESSADFWNVAGVSRSLSVWCSEVVVEVNDGFSLGSYGLTPAL